MRSAASEQKARMKPRLDLRASANFENDVDGVEGRRDKTVVELLLRYNLYNGGTDEATLRRFKELHLESEENLRKVERDVRQAVLVAYNDIHAIEKQLPDLEQHRNSADAMRKAYTQQFEVGRRSLLDLLDAENEYFQANRAYANAEFNLVNARARYLAATGKLLATFKISREDVPTLEQMGITPEIYKAGARGGN
jgi:Outer membrane protein